MVPAKAPVRSTINRCICAIVVVICRNSGSLNCKVSYILVPFILWGTDQPRPRGTFFMSGMRTSADQRRRQNSSSLSFRSTSLTTSNQLNGHVIGFSSCRTWSSIIAQWASNQCLHLKISMAATIYHSPRKTTTPTCLCQTWPTRSRRKILIDVEEVTARLQSHLNQTVVTLANLQTERLGSRQE
jgi:hypothetical protein